MTTHACVLCNPIDEQVITTTALYRVIWANDNPLYPLYCRLIWREHVCEYSEVSDHDMPALWQGVKIIEQGLCRVQPTPHKINIASLGNQVPHLHWHVVARYADDVHFPHSIWSASNHAANQDFIAQCAQQRGEVEQFIQNSLTKQP